MSSDIKQILRERHVRLAAETNLAAAARRQDELEDAAAHIEALEGEVASAKTLAADEAAFGRAQIRRAEAAEAEVKRWGAIGDAHDTEISSLRIALKETGAEVERLREALKEIAVVEPEWGTQWFIEIARKALGGKT
jgi:hypothetical protein